jgi:hypothetical protein
MSGCPALADSVQEIINAEEDTGRVLDDKQIICIEGSAFIYMWFSDQVTPTITL